MFFFGLYIDFSKLNGFLKKFFAFLTWWKYLQSFKILVFSVAYKKNTFKNEKKNVLHSLKKKSYMFNLKKNHIIDQNETLESRVLWIQIKLY